jgi:hypothetical protein
MTEPQLQPDSNHAGYIAFGDGQTDLMPQQWAEEILRLLYADHRQIFGELMLKRLGIDKLPRKRAST